MNKKALFRLDSGGKYGLGHIMRSKALADALHRTGIDCVFAVKQIHSHKAVNPHQLIVIHHEDELLTLAEHYDAVIIDHYHYTSELFYALSQLEQLLLIVLDDECNRGPLYADLIVNPVNQAKALPYNDIAPKAKLLLGSDYILLGQNFLQCDSQDFNVRNAIIITFGGSDVSNLTLPVLKVLTKSSLSEFNIVVVTGAACDDTDTIKDYCRQHDLDHQHNVENMADLFSKARFAISAAGSTAFELACCGVPAVFAVVADNQLLSIKEQSQKGWCTMIDCRTENKAEELVHEAEQMIYSPQLASLSQIARSLVGAHGADRVASQIRETINVRD